MKRVTNFSKVPKMFQKLLCLSLFFLSLNSFANMSIEAGFSPRGSRGAVPTFDYNKSTIIFLIGKSGDLGNAPFLSAYMRAKYIHELMPDKQIVLYRVREYSASKDKRLTTFDPDIKITVFDDTHPDGKQLIEYLDKFTSIHAMHFYGHSAPWYMKTESGTVASKISLNVIDGLMEWTQGNIEDLKDNFERGAYFTINGCNSGFEFAPALSKAWNIPVMGALTGSTFQKLHTDGNWYQAHDDASGSYYPEGGWAQSLPLDGTHSIPCPADGCYRMAPDLLGYVGYWGKLNAAFLPYFKFFCSMDNAHNDDYCRRAMAENLITTPSVSRATLKPTRAEYIEKMKDFVCPNSYNVSFVPYNLTACKTTVDKIVAYADQFPRLNYKLQDAKNKVEFNPSQTPLLSCPLGEKCVFKDIKCKWDPTGEAYKGSCKLLLNEKSIDRFAFGNEVIDYLMAFDDNL